MTYRIRRRKIELMIAELDTLLAARDIVIFPVSITFALFEALKVAEVTAHEKYGHLRAKWQLTRRDDKLICIDRQLKASWRHHRGGPGRTRRTSVQRAD